MKAIVCPAKSPKPAESCYVTPVGRCSERSQKGYQPSAKINWHHISYMFIPLKICLKLSNQISKFLFCVQLLSLKLQSITKWKFHQKLCKKWENRSWQRNVLVASSHAEKILCRQKKKVFEMEQTWIQERVRTGTEQPGAISWNVCECSQFYEGSRPHATRTLKRKGRARSPSRDHDTVTWQGV